MSVEAPNVMVASPENSQSSDQANFAYILSANFSGSTLLAMLLGSQSEAVTVGEMRAPAIGDPDAYRCSCGQPIKQCEFWSKVNAGMARKGIPDFDITEARISIHHSKSKYVNRLLDPMPKGPLLETVRAAALSLSPAWPPHRREIHFRNRALAEVLREVTGARLVIDSSKISLHLKYLLQSPDLKIKIIRLVRDGRAVTVSTMGHGFKRDSRRETVAGAARSWRRNNEAAERILSNTPASRWMFVKYEELCRQPEATLRGICKFLGMDTRQIMLDFRAKEQHVLGNEMRLKSGSDIRLDERWRKELSQEDLATFDEVAGDLNRQYGYA
jgi:hypothetical protein